MDMFAVNSCAAPTEAERMALDALLDQGEEQVSGLLEVAELIEEVYSDEGLEPPSNITVELSAVRKSGGVTAAVRRAELRTNRRFERARLRALTEVLADGVVSATQLHPAKQAHHVADGWAA